MGEGGEGGDNEKKRGRGRDMRKEREGGEC